MKKQPEKQIQAEVLLKADGEQPQKSRGVADAGSGTDPDAAQQALNDIVSKLREWGFEVTAASPTSISIAGPRELFEQVFQTKLSGPSSSLNVPEELQHAIEGIYVQMPPTYHSSFS